MTPKNLLAKNVLVVCSKTIKIVLVKNVLDGCSKTTKKACFTTEVVCIAYLTLIDIVSSFFVSLYTYI